MKHVAIDQTIMVKDMPAQAGSHIMDGFNSPFDAEVVTRLKGKGIEISQTATGEFGLDLVGEFSYGREQQGKLAGEAATLVKEGKADAALAVDMNGSARRAAVLADIDFIKPTYGTVSRYGVISCAASGEQVGVYAPDAAAAAEALEMISGHDDKDGTSLSADAYSYESDLNVKGYESDLNVKGMRVAIDKGVLEKADDATKLKVVEFGKKLQAKGVEVEVISYDMYEAANTAWQILMCAETCNNISRYDGVKFGHRSDKFRNIDELYINTRTEGFNFLTKAVILYGSDVLSKSRYADCYDKSLRVRRIVAEGFERLFEKYDAILTPACSSAEFESYDIADAFEKVFAESEFTAVANLVGFPAAAGCGVQLMGDRFSESKLLSLLGCQERKGE